MWVYLFLAMSLLFFAKYLLHPKIILSLDWSLNIDWSSSSMQIIWGF